MTKKLTKTWLKIDCGFYNKYIYKLTRSVSIVLYDFYDTKDELKIEADVLIVCGDEDVEIKIGQYKDLAIAKYKSFTLAKSQLDKLQKKIVTAAIATQFVRRLDVEMPSRKEITK